MEELAGMLQVLLRTPKQVAYFMDPYTRPHRKRFMRLRDTMDRRRYVNCFRFVRSETKVRILIYFDLF